MALNARPNLNGNTPEDFTRAGRAVLSAVLDLREALKTARTDCLHGRNYQTVPEAEAAQKADLDRLNGLEAQLEEFFLLSTDLYDAGRK